MKPRMFAWLILLALVVGCGGSSGKVAGKVRLNGAPITVGLVSAYDEKGGLATAGNLTEDGYLLEGLPPGKYTLTVVAHRPGGDPIVDIPGLPKLPPRVPPDKAKEYLEKAASPEAKKILDRLKPVPKKYTSIKESGLAVTVLAGATAPMDIEMTGTGEIIYPPAGKGKH